MNLGLERKQVQSVLIEYTVRMELTDAYFVVVESPLTIEAEGKVVSLSPEGDTDEDFGPVRALVGQTITAAVASKKGELSLTFGDGVRLVVEPDPAYEAWSVSGPGGALVVSTPGGKLAVWSAHPADDT